MSSEDLRTRKTKLNYHVISLRFLIKKLQSDEAFAEEFKAYLAGADSKVKEGTREVGKQLDKVVMDTIRGFAESKGMTLSDDEGVSKTLGNMSAQISKQLDEMILKQFKAMEIINKSSK